MIFVLHVRVRDMLSLMDSADAAYIRLHSSYDTYPLKGCVFPTLTQMCDIRVRYMCPRPNGNRNCNRKTVTVSVTVTVTVTVKT